MANKTNGFASFIGVDLHKETVTLVAVDPSGNQIDRLKISTKCVERIDTWIRNLPGPKWMAVEAVGFFEWFTERFRRSVDRIDIADDQLMQLRKLGRHWRQLSRTIARAKHCMRWLLLAANIRGPKFDAASAQRWLLAHGHLLKKAQRNAFANFLDIIALIEQQRVTLRRQIIAANKSPRFIEDIKILQSVPGIMHIWACIILAEIGDFDRFPNADALEFWAGLTADVEESAGGINLDRILPKPAAPPSDEPFVRPPSPCADPTPSRRLSDSDSSNAPASPRPTSPWAEGCCAPSMP